MISNKCSHSASTFFHPPRLYTLHSTPYTSTILKILFLCTFLISPVLITKDEPRKNQGTT